MANTISWYEIPVTDFDRAADFYSALLDTHITRQHMRPDLVYGMIPNGNVGVGGALAQSSQHVPSDTGVVIYLFVVGIEAALARIEGKGGTAFGTKVSLGDEYGGAFVIHLRDCEGNRIGLFSEH